ncbi:hypothetical protein T440DRAFT_109214 [Plenodomus tracheiphilus IPT5]|uniref:Uncharacterized protein n=1 Tax=Plenodomus tracheiphilus IPT5 TaxID=1408161 RepID=A0A6A7B3Z3_9PLEO|nr:hypothetical protein T440DRAFT_109214 [Plenodomus tracheiphilus IPT5]
MYLVVYFAVSIRYTYVHTTSPPPIQPHGHLHRNSKLYYPCPLLSTLPSTLPFPRSIAIAIASVITKPYTATFTPHIPCHTITTATKQVVVVAAWAIDRPARSEVLHRFVRLPRVLWGRVGWLGEKGRVYVNHTISNCTVKRALLWRFGDVSFSQRGVMDIECSMYPVSQGSVVYV